MYICNMVRSYFYIHYHKQEEMGVLCYTHEKETDLGRQSVSLTRCRRSSISCVGPPPPSPKPNNNALWFARPLSLLFFTVFINCIETKEAVMRWAFTRDISKMLCHIMSYLRLPLYPSSHRSYLEENEWELLSRQYPPKRMCCAIGKREFKHHTQPVYRDFTWADMIGTYWKCINKVPAQLLSNKTRDPTTFHYLRQLCRVTKRIW